MSVTAAGSPADIQQALNALRQTVQAEQVAAAAMSEAAAQVAKSAVQQSAQPAAQPAPRIEGVGETLDVKA